MIYFILAVLFVGILFYAIFGGADYGAGILELAKGRKLRQEQSKAIYKAIGPVWEANHVWLILVLVIMFNNFPAIFYEISVKLHIPLSLILVGIIVRGTTFTFRHYDVYQSKGHELYDLSFAYSSAWTTFWIGVTVGSLIHGQIPEHPKDFLDGYVLHWMNSFCFLVGIFVTALFTFLASIFLVSETKDQEVQEIFRSRAYFSNLGAFISGAFIFADGFFHNNEIIRHFITNPLSLICFSLSTILLIAQWWVDKNDKQEYLRSLGVVQFTLILSGLTSAIYPNVITFKDTQRTLTLFNSAAPESTQFQLTIALIGGIIVIFPALFYLFKVFKKDSFNN